MSVMRAYSAIAAVQLNTWKSGSRRVYWQDTSGNVRESGIEGNTWFLGATLVTARINTPLAAVAWGTKPEIRVFYIAGNGILSEWMLINGNQWTQGPLSSLNIQLPANEAPKLTACMIGDANIRLYYPVPGQRSFQELIGNGANWSLGSKISLPELLRGGIAATTFRDSSGVHIRIYWQDYNYIVRETCFDDGQGWRDSGMSQGYAPDVNSFAAVAFFAGGKIQLRRYNWKYWSNVSEPASDEITCIENGFNGSRWTGPALLLPANYGTSVAAVTWEDAQKQQQIKLYYQNKRFPLAEVAWDPVNIGWNFGGKVPSGD